MSKNLVLPTIEQIEWANCEIGVLIHYDMKTYEPDYVWQETLGYAPDPKIFNPDKLSTDQWIEAAVAAGAKYAILVAKHCSGFCLWPTKVHPYNISASPWKNGKGDIVADFIKSCKKYGVRPGLYYSANANGYLGISVERIKIGNGTSEDENYPLAKSLREHTKSSIQAYYKIIMAQLTEIWSQYGELFEIWFDGGVIPVEEGGPDIASLLHELQPNAVVFQGPPGTKSLIRWVGNECGIAAENTSSIVDYEQECFDGKEERIYAGNTRGNLWCPAESDMPNRSIDLAFSGGWFWKEGEEKYVYSPEELFEKYMSSVGRNTNLLLGMVIDESGQFPKADTDAFEGFGKIISKVFCEPLFKLSYPESKSLYTFDLSPDKAAKFIVLSEDIAFGERVTSFRISHIEGNKETLIYKGEIIGHKRILPLGTLNKGVLCVNIDESKADVKFKEIAIY